MEPRGMDVVQIAKGELRKEMRRRLRALETEYIRSQSARTVEALREKQAFRVARSVVAYASMEKEFRTDALLSAVFAAGKRCYLPVVTDVDAREMKMLEARGMEDVSSWRKSPWGIPEPPADDPTRTNALDDPNVDLILVPGLAFDLKGGRLGHGKGFYDTFLSRCLERRKDLAEPAPAIIGLALTEQIVPEVPMAKHDRYLDFVMYAGGD